MKDKNGVEIRVGDTIRRLSDDEEATVGAIHPSESGDSIVPTESNWSTRIVVGRDEQTFRWEVIQTADGSDPRQGVRVDPPVAYATATFDTGDWAQLTTTLRLLHQPLPRHPHELYAEFHRVVTETVKREAPKVRVVTDFKGEFGLAWFSIGEVRSQMGYQLCSDQYWVNNTRAALKFLRDQLLR